MESNRKPPRFIFTHTKRTFDNNDSLTTPIIDPNAPVSNTGPHFPTFDAPTENGFGQILQEISQSVSDAYEIPKQEKPANVSTTFPSFPSLTNSSIPTPAIKYNHRHQQQQSQPSAQTPSQSESQSQNSSQIQQTSSPAQPYSQNESTTNNHRLTNGQNNEQFANIQSTPIPPKAPSPLNVKLSASSFHIAASPSSSSSSSHNYNNYLTPKHGAIEYSSNNSSHSGPIPTTVITTGCLASTASAPTTVVTHHQSRVIDLNHRLSSTTANPSSSLSPPPPPTTLPQSLTSASVSTSNLSNNNNYFNNILSVSTEDASYSSSRLNHLSSNRRHPPFSPVSTLSTSSQASTVGKDSARYLNVSGSDDEQTTRATPGRKKKMDPSRRSKLTKREKLDKIINEEKQLQASNLALKQRIASMEKDFNILQTIITNILIDAAKRKRSEAEDLKEST